MVGPARLAHIRLTSAGIRLRGRGLGKPLFRRSQRTNRVNRLLRSLPGLSRFTQAILLRRRAAPPLLAAWAHLAGTHHQRLAHFFGSESPLWIHRPSLVQHLATDSSWGARISRALDF